MKTQVLCVDDNRSRLMGRHKTLEDAGFAVLGASDEMQAVELLATQRVDVVCVDSRFLRTGGTGIGASIKSAKPHVRSSSCVTTARSPLASASMLTALKDRILMRGRNG